MWGGIGMRLLLKWGGWVFIAAFIALNIYYYYLTGEFIRRIPLGTIPHYL
jgi:hypothetical protein